MQNVSSRLQAVYGEPDKPNHGMLGIRSLEVISHGLANIFARLLGRRA